MARVLQITIESNKGSVGRIAEQIGLYCIENGWESAIAFSRISNESRSRLIRIGNNIDIYLSVLLARIFDSDGFNSKRATRRFLRVIGDLKPDIIHLHHLHGYFINIELLFVFLKRSGLPIVWTFHDSWSFTGHCTNFETIDCKKWLTQCEKCPLYGSYPRSLFLDNSRSNFIRKKYLFTSVNNLTIVSPSTWMSDLVKRSFFGGVNQEVIKNGINLEVFKPKSSKPKVEAFLGCTGKFIILGVASIWTKNKGLDVFIALNGLIDHDYMAIILVGLAESQIKALPPGIIGLPRTESVVQLADIYSAADVFFNPTFEDTYPTTNLEAIACGTPVITFKTGGSVESVNVMTGMVVEKGDMNGVLNSINHVKSLGTDFYRTRCRNYAVLNFDYRRSASDYFALYKKILKI